MNLFLVGMPASGKTTIGLALADRLGLQFFDSDYEIENKNQMPISEIFKTKGEEFFRAEELIFLQQWKKDQCIVATGGGMPCSDKNIRIMKKKGRIIYLNCPISVILERLQHQLSMRPKFSDTSKSSLLKVVDELFNNREKFYKQADFIVDGQQSISKIVNVIEHNLSL